MHTNGNLYQDSPSVFLVPYGAIKRQGAITHSNAPSDFKTMHTASTVAYPETEGVTMNPQIVTEALGSAKASFVPGQILCLSLSGLFGTMRTVTPYCSTSLVCHPTSCMKTSHLGLGWRTKLLGSTLSA